MPWREPPILCARNPRLFPECRNCKLNPDRAPSQWLEPGHSDWVWPTLDADGVCEDHVPEEVRRYG